MSTLEQRKDLLIACSKDIKLQRAVFNECRDDILFWFDWFAYTFNPRVKPAHLPFNLYPFQKNVVLLLQKCIDEGEPLIIEKSRDMGLSWLVMLTFQWFWLFHDGVDFLCGSKVQDDVDKKGDRSTLFQKFRFNLDYQPLWILPEMHRFHDSFLKILNPRNGNTLAGQAATSDFGRGQRYRAVLMDEIARHPYGQYAYESVSHSTNCVILLFTPFGKANIAYNMRSHPDVEWVDIGGNDDGIQCTA
jgi:hypothetical protein